MMMTYLGSFKSFLYLPIFETLGANVWTIRLPVVLVGAATIFIFYQLLFASLGRNAALLGTFLLATDPLFLMTNTFDWGPVALEHFLLVTGCWALFQFGSRNGSKWLLAVGFFCFGLALWNKAIFLWAFAGISVATVTVLWPHFRRHFTLVNLGIAAAALLVGAAPFVYYNIENPLITFRQNVHLAPEEIPGKWVQVETALQGTSLFGYIASEEWMEPAKAPQGAVGKASTALRDAIGPRRTSGFYYVLGALLLLIPLWWRSRAAWFSLVFLAVAWLWMAMTHDAGGGAHHVALLWPFPILFAAAALRRLPGRALLPVGLLLVGMNLLVVNQYLAQLVRYGAHNTFTDAIYPLSDSLSETSGNTFYVTDWGMYDALNLLHKGKLPLGVGSFALVPDRPNEEQMSGFLRMLHDPKGLLIGHVNGRETYTDVNRHRDKLVAAEGFRLEVVRTVQDSNGRPIFEIARALPLSK
jgi:4-amino-4-deoxy-L-arabinose transferase-like glycosyltransferase